jgi:hypothetical protein
VVDTGCSQRNVKAPEVLGRYLRALNRVVAQ